MKIRDCSYALFEICVFCRKRRVILGTIKIKQGDIPLLNEAVDTTFHKCEECGKRYFYHKGRLWYRNADERWNAYRTETTFIFR